MPVSVVLETWNLGATANALAEELDRLALQLDRLAPQLAAHATELVITHVGIAAARRAELARRTAHGGHAARRHGRPRLQITWLELPESAGYYDHKNLGFDATSGDIVVFIDGDCAPSRTWLESMVAPFLEGAQVVAGATSYAGALGPLASQLDFPYFDARERNRSFAAGSPSHSPTVRNFFANNVAFARDVFASRHYPAIAPMFHGQCQVLALHLVEAGIPITYAPNARVTHAFPDSLRELLEVRLLRGADTTQLLPYVAATYAPRTQTAVRRLGPLPALALLAIRAVTGTAAALRKGPPARGLALVAVCTALDAIGALARPLVYRAYGVSSTPKQMVSDTIYQAA